MARIYIPTRNPVDWKQYLAEPDKQWRTGYSACTLAHCWHDADGFPAEIDILFKTAPIPALHNVRPLLILPEYKVKLPGRGYDSQNDIFVLGKADDGALVSIMVEGKVNEPFGPTVGEWKLAGSGNKSNKQLRLAELGRLVGLPHVPDTLYYQLLHRTASAVIEAKTYNAPYSVMIVHSFSPEHAHWDAFVGFVGLYGQTPNRGQMVDLGDVGGVRLFVGWVHGDERFLLM